MPTPKIKRCPFCQCSLINPYADKKSFEHPPEFRNACFVGWATVRIDDDSLIFWNTRDGPAKGREDDTD